MRKVTQVETNLEPVVKFLNAHPNELYSVEQIALRTGQSVNLVRPRLEFLASGNRWEALKYIDGKYVWKDANRLVGSGEMADVQKAKKPYVKSGLDKKRVYDVLYREFKHRVFTVEEATDALVREAPVLSESSAKNYLRVLKASGSLRREKRGEYRVMSGKRPVLQQSVHGKNTRKAPVERKAVKKKKMPEKTLPIAKLVDFFQQPENQNREITLDYLESCFPEYARTGISSGVASYIREHLGNLSRKARGIYYYSTGGTESGGEWVKYDMPDSTCVFIGKGEVWEGKRLK